MSVKYKSIKGFTGYRVGSDGSVWSKRRTGNGSGVLAKSWKQLVAYLNNGYVKVTLRKEKKSHLKQVAHLVLEAFRGPMPDGRQARHLDDDTSNNRLSNLRWGTFLENCQDRLANGGYSRGEQHCNATLTVEIVIQIRKLRKNHGYGATKIGQILNLPRGTVGNIIYGKAWSHVK